MTHELELLKANHNRSKVAMRLFGAVVLVNGLIIALACFWIYKSKAAHEDGAKIQTQNLAKVIEENIIGHIKQVSVILRDEADELSSRMSSDNLNWDEVSIILNRHAGYLPDGVGLRVSDVNGKTVYSSRGAFIAQSYVGNREDFITDKNRTELTTNITAPIYGDESKKWLLIASRRITNI